MQNNHTSLTATGTAILRAIESQKSVGYRICYDPYARLFAPAWLFYLVRLLERSGYGERRVPGLIGFVAARERHIDEHLNTCISRGLEQLIILGSGFDSRPYRFTPLESGVKVFEIDQPATLRAKQAGLQRIFGRLPEHVTFVPLNLNTQSLSQSLTESGYDPSLKTLFIGQGIMPYLTEEAVDGVLKFVTNYSPPGSTIVFDFMYPTILDGRLKRNEIDIMRQLRWLKREVLTFSLPEGTIQPFLSERGFEQIENFTSHDLHQTYFTGNRARRTIADGYAIVSAVVKAHRV